MLFILPLLSLASMAAADCFSSVDTSHAIGSLQFATQISCSEKCTGYPYVALRDGAYCYCLSSKPTSNQVSESQCNVQCNGFGAANCGGSSTFSVYISTNEDSDSAVSAASSASPSTLSSAPASSSASPSSTTSATTSATNSATTSAATSSTASSVSSPASESSSSAASSSTSDSDSSSPSTSATSASKSSATSSESVAVHTVTQTPTSQPSSSASASSRPSPQKKSSVGPIVGGVVGGIAGALILAFAAFFFIRRRNSRDDDDEEDLYKKGASGGNLNRGVSSKSRKFNSVFDMPMSNPFVHPSEEFAEKRASASAPTELADPRLNPVMMGRRRLSEGSLADEADYSRKILGVANP